MKYKFIFIVLSSSELHETNSYYNSVNKYSMFKTLQKKYLDIFKNDIKFFFIEYKNINENIIEVDDYIYIKGKEEPIIPNMLIKKLKAMIYIKSKYNFDYIINTNLTTIWNIPSLMSLYNIIPRQNFFGGHYIFNAFISGTGIIISNDILHVLLCLNGYTIQIEEDVAISRFMKSKNIPIFNLENLQNYKLNYQILDKNESNINSHHHKIHNLEINENTNTNDILYFRIKSQSQEQDIIVAKNIIKKLYNIVL